MSELSVHPEVPDTEHWRQVRILLERSPGNAAFRLKIPSPAPCPSTSRATSLFRSCKDSSQHRLLVRHLLTCLAQPGNDARRLKNCLEEYRHEAGFSPGHLDDLFRARWICVPVPVVQGRQGRVVHLMLGLVPGTGQVHPLEADAFAPASAAALKTVLSHWNEQQAGDTSDLLCWRLHRPEGNNDLTGASLGLPAALGLHLLAEGRVWPAGFFATGRLDRRGAVLPVQGIRRKRDALNRRCSLFLVPQDKKLGQRPEPATAHVASLAEARLYLDCFLGGIRQANDLRVCTLTLHDPDQLVRQFDRLPPAFCTLPTLEPMLAEIRRRVIEEKDAQAMDRLARCLRQHNAPLERAEMLRDLFAPDDMPGIGSTHPAPALSWCLGMADLHNHRGDVAASRAWSACADRLKTAIGGADDHVFHANIRQVTERFNRYDFRPELPASFTEALARREQICAINDGRDDRVLGALYGTQAQNFGFCGPAHLSGLRQALERARVSFGRTSPDQATRLHNYLVYALLDAKAWDEAARTLRVYLGLPPGSGADAWLAAATALLADAMPDSPYRVAATLRLLAEQADTPGPPTPARLLLPFTRAALHRQHHPWQLVGVNLARLYLRADDITTARRLLSHAVVTCRRGGETLQVMALLPLSVLHAHRLATRKDYDLAMTIRQELCDSTTINQNHFRHILPPSSGQDILHQTEANRAALFPFSYR